MATVQRTQAPTGTPGVTHFTPSNLARGVVCGTSLNGYDRWLSSAADRGKAASEALKLCSKAHGGATCPKPTCQSFRNTPQRPVRAPTRRSSAAEERAIEESKRGAAEAVHNFLRMQREQKIDRLIREHRL